MQESWTMEDWRNEVERLRVKAAKSEAEARGYWEEVERLMATLEALATWSVPVIDPDPETPQTEYGQMKKFARAALAKEEADEVTTMSAIRNGVEGRWVWHPGLAKEGMSDDIETIREGLRYGPNHNRGKADAALDRIKAEAERLRHFEGRAFTAEAEVERLRAALDKVERATDIEAAWRTARAALAKEDPQQQSSNSVRAALAEEIKDA